MDISTISKTRRDTINHFGRLRRAWNLYAIHLLKPLGLAPKQSLFLRTLHQIGPCSPADIALHTFTDPAAIVRLTDVLVARGWVIRQEHLSDRRRWTVRLSHQGGQMAVKLDRVITKSTRCLLSALDERELRLFNRLLEKLLAPHLPGKPGGKNTQRNHP